MALGASGLETACFISDFRVQTSDFRRQAALPGPALTTFPERRHRVHTRMRLLPPLTTALTAWRFGSNRRALTLFAWLCCRPTTGPFPHNSHRFAIMIQLS